MCDAHTVSGVFMQIWQVNRPLVQFYATPVTIKSYLCRSLKNNLMGGYNLLTHLYRLQNNEFSFNMSHYHFMTKPIQTNYIDNKQKQQGHIMFQTASFLSDACKQAMLQDEL